VTGRERVGDELGRWIGIRGIPGVGMSRLLQGGLDGWANLSRCTLIDWIAGVPSVCQDPLTPMAGPGRDAFEVGTSVAMAG